MGGHVLQPAGLPDEAKRGLLGAQAPLLAVQGGHVPEDVGAAPPGDHLGGGRRLRSSAAPPPHSAHRPRAAAGGEGGAASPTAGSRPAARSTAPRGPARGGCPGRPAGRRRPAGSRPPPGGRTGTSAPAPSGGSNTGAWPSCRWEGRGGEAGWEGSPPRQAHPASLTGRRHSPRSPAAGRAAQVSELLRGQVSLSSGAPRTRTDVAGLVYRSSSPREGLSSASVPARRETGPRHGAATSRTLHPANSPSSPSPSQKACWGPACPHPRAGGNSAARWSRVRVILHARGGVSGKEPRGLRRRPGRCAAESREPWNPEQEELLTPAPQAGENQP